MSEYLKKGSFLRDVQKEGKSKKKGKSGALAKVLVKMYSKKG